MALPANSGRMDSGNPNTPQSDVGSGGPTVPLNSPQPIPAPAAAVNATSFGPSAQNPDNSPVAYPFTAQPVVIGGGPDMAMQSGLGINMGATSMGAAPTGGTAFPSGALPPVTPPEQQGAGQGGAAPVPPALNPINPNPINPAQGPDPGPAWYQSTSTRTPSRQGS